MKETKSIQINFTIFRNNVEIRPDSRLKESYSKQTKTDRPQDKRIKLTIGRKSNIIVENNILIHQTINKSIRVYGKRFGDAPSNEIFYRDTNRKYYIWLPMHQGMYQIKPFMKIYKALLAMTISRREKKKHRKLINHPNTLEQPNRR